MKANDGFDLFLGDIRAFNHDLIPYHDRRRHRQIQFEIRVGLVIGVGEKPSPLAEDSSKLAVRKRSGSA